MGKFLYSWHVSFFFKIVYFLLSCLRNGFDLRYKSGEGHVKRFSDVIFVGFVVDREFQLFKERTCIGHFCVIGQWPVARSQERPVGRESGNAVDKICDFLPW